MKRFFTFFLALLTMVGVANAAESPVSGSIQAGKEYSIADASGSADDYYTTSEVIGAGQTVVVFYYNHSTDAILGTSPIYFGPQGVNPLSRDKNLKDAAGNSVCKLVANTSNAFDAEGHAVIEVYQPKEEGATWTYVICTEAEATTLAVPEFGGGKVDPIAPVSGSLVEKTEYTIPGTGNSFDKFYTCTETLSAGQTIVAFYYSHEPGTLMKVPVYFGPGGKNPLSTTKTEVDAAGNKVARVVADASTLLDGDNHPVIELYQPDNANATWCYVICSAEEAATIAIPEFGATGGGDTPQVVPGQDIENAIVLTKDVAANFKSTKKEVFVKFVAPNSGTVTMTLSQENNYARWMEDGVMAYGQLKQNYFSNGNQFNVEKGKTYYCRYGFAEDVEGTVSYSLLASEEGAARGEAILLESNGQQNLLGIAHTGSGQNAVYTNKTTWFKLEKDGALDGKDLVTVTIGGSNETEVALFKNDETDATKSYAMGSGSGMLPVNSTVKFDINLAENDYYIAITQDDVNGTANFTFSEAQPGETMLKAFTAVEGENTVTTAGWYKYAHTGDTKYIKFSGINKIVNENGGNVAEGDDVKVGFAIADGTTIYFEAAANFTITLSDLEAGMTPENAVVITNSEGATFKLNSGVATDTQRFMKYVATEDGTFLYGTTNAKVIEFAVSATVRDVTNPDAPKAVSIVQENTDFGETYFIYKWPVVAGHTYAIEQGLGNNFGTVEFLTMFTAAEAGETIGKAIGVDLYGAVDLGRKAATVKYYKFTAEDAGDYTLSVQMKGYVKSYDAEGVGTSIAQSYSDGLTYHNGTFTLAKGETLVFSCEPSETIEHIDVAIQDQFIPNYYATVTKADETGGLDYNQPMAINVDDETSIDLNNVWHGPIAVPAGETLYVVANTEADVNAIYFAVETTNGLQWINKNTELAVEKEDGKQIYTLTAADADRNIQIMSYGMKCEGTFTATFTDPKFTPADPLTFAVTPEYAYDFDTKELTVSFTVPQTYKDSETAVENLNLAAAKIKNVTTGEEMEITTGAGEGAYNAGDTFSVTNTLTFDVNEGDVLSISLETWGQDNITIEVATSSPIVMPIDENAYYMVITNGETQQKIKVSADVKLEWKKGSELKK